MQEIPENCSALLCSALLCCALLCSALLDAIANPCMTCFTTHTLECDCRWLAMGCMAHALSLLIKDFSREKNDKVKCGVGRVVTQVRLPEVRMLCM